MKLLHRLCDDDMATPAQCTAMHPHIQIAPIIPTISRTTSQPVDVTLVVVVARLSGDAVSPGAEEPNKPSELLGRGGIRATDRSEPVQTLSHASKNHEKIMSFLC
jgi:hypothetical protein